MANTQTKTGFWRRLHGWAGRHKIKAALCFVVLAGLLYAGGSRVVLQVQIHAERERFMAAADLVTELDNTVLEFSPLSNGVTKSCTYSDNGALFATKFLGCEVDADTNIENSPPTKASEVSDVLLSAARKAGVDPRSDDASMDSYGMTKYVFTYKGIKCGFSTNYYSDSVPQSQRYAEAIQNGGDILITLGCSGSARSAYFPVTED